MSEKYEIVLISIGSRKDKILSYIRNYSQMGYKETLELLERLPVTIKTTNSKFEAKIIKEALNTLGATVEINSNEDSDLGFHGYSSIETTSEEHSIFSNNTASARKHSHLSIGTDCEGPITESKGCYGIFIAGLLLILSGIIGLSLIL